MSQLACAPLARGSAPRWLRQLDAGEREWKVLQRAPGDGRPAPLGAELVRLTSRVQSPGTRWIVRVAGRDEDVAYLREAVAGIDPHVTWTAAPSHGWQHSEAVVHASDGDAVRSALLRGEGASDYTLLMLLVSESDISDVSALLRDHEDSAAFDRGRLVLVHRLGYAWAAVSWPAGTTPFPPSLVTIDTLPSRPVAMTSSRRTTQLGVAAILVGAVAVAVIGVARRGTGPDVRQPTDVASPTVVTTPSVVIPAPQARQLAASAYSPDGGVTVLFGGIATSGSGTLLGDTWTWDGRSWNQVGSAALASSGASPSPRYGAVMAYAPGAHGVVLFGGTSRDPARGLLNDTWVWNRSGWTRLDVTGPPATAVTVAMTYDLSWGQLVLVTADSQTHPEQLQTWTWNAETSPPLVPGGLKWTLRTDTGTPQIHLMAPDPRGGHVIGLVSTRSGPAEESTWRWDGRSWQQLSLQNDVVVESISATLTADVFDSTVVLVEEQFIDQTGEDRGGTWTWDGATWTHHAGGVPDAVHAFDVTQPVWFPHNDGLDIVGGPRLGASYNAVWFWDGLVWSRAGVALSATYAPSQ